MRVRPKTMTLAELALACHLFAKDRIAAGNVAAVQGMYRQMAKIHASTPPLVVDLQKRVGLGERPFDFCKGQSERTLSYSAVALSDEDAAVFRETWPWPLGGGTRATQGAAAGELSDAPMDAPANALPDDGAAGGYSSVPDAGEYPLFYVKIQACGSARTEAEPADVSDSELLFADHCLPSRLEDPHITHICSALWCTCMVFRLWGLPCAHMFRAMFAENRTRVPNGVVHRRWLPDDAERAKSLVRLRTATVNNGVHVHDLSQRRNEELTADQRYANLMVAGEVVASLGSLSQSMYKVIMAQIAQMHARARTVTLVPESKGLRQQAAAVRIAEAAEKRAARAREGQGVAGAPTAEEEEGADSSEDVLILLNRKGKSDMGKRKRNAANFAKEAGAKAAKKAKKAETVRVSSTKPKDAAKPRPKAAKPKTPSGGNT